VRLRQLLKRSNDGVVFIDFDAHEVRVRAPQGTLTLQKRGTDVAVVVFGNADAALRDLQTRVIAALEIVPQHSG